MKKDLLILESDKDYARKRIAELDDEIFFKVPYAIKNIEYQDDTVNS